MTDEERNWLRDMDLKLVKNPFAEDHYLAVSAGGKLDLYSSSGNVVMSLTYDARNMIVLLLDTEEATDILFNSMLIQIREKIKKERDAGIELNALKKMADKNICSSGNFSSVNMPLKQWSQGIAKSTGFIIAAALSGTLDAYLLMKK